MGTVRLQELLHGLGELIGALIDIEREGLLSRSLIVNIKFVSKALTRHILAKCDNFLLNCRDVSDIDLPFLACFASLEQI